ncbi:MAG: NfeD family protein [Alcaligenaceae bacterium]|jgi:membrane protein implicated in regulation of membrane protease activity|nr:NfeD family protein [Alcaligenaceae bacterium]
MWFWFVFALAALIGEVLSGTFYLLLIAVGLAAGGIVAALGVSFPMQLLAVAVVTGLGLLVLRKTHVLKKREINAATNRDVNLDIGQVVSVAGWGQGHTTQVRYRGALWSARLAAGYPAAGGSHRIVEIDGSVLVLVPLQAS